MRLEILVPDETYESLQQAASRRKRTVSELVLKGIDQQLATESDEAGWEPQIPKLNLGKILIPESEWRLLANERPLD
jgi:hypothetical protein